MKIVRALLASTVFAVAGLSSALPYPTGATLPEATDRPVPPIVQRWMDAWNRGDAVGMAALFTDDGVYQDFAFQAKNSGKDGVAGWVRLTVKNIPHTHGAILDAFQVGDRATVQWVFSGGPLPDTGRSFSVPVASVFQLRGGKIAQVIDYYNRADLYHQAGRPSDNWQPPTP